MSSRDPHQVQWRTGASQMPVRLDGGGVVARADGVILVVRDIRLYRTAVQFELLATVEPATSRRLNLSDRPIDLTGWIDRPARDATIGVAVDGRALPVVPPNGRWPPRQGHLAVLTNDSSAHTDAGGASAFTKFWVPLVPIRSLVVTAESAVLGLSGATELDATDWQKRTADVCDR